MLSNEQEYFFFQSILQSFAGIDSFVEVGSLAIAVRFTEMTVLQ